jgi:glycosyltransferase involved in cell wall biosynthesis
VRRQLSIVHVTRSPVGGIFRHISDLARAQHEAGHQVGLICDSTTGGALQEERIAALAPHLTLGVARLPMPRSIAPADVRTALAVARCVAGMRPDVVHCHGAKGGVYGRLAATRERRRGHPTAAFYAPHGGSLHFAPTSPAGRVYFGVERALERVTDGLIHVCAYEARTYRQKVGTPRCPAHVVLNGLGPEEFEPVIPARGAADFLYIGELRDLKGVDVFIEALALLESGGDMPRALIVGPAAPDDARRYRDMANAKRLANRVAFHAPMPARNAFPLARTVVLPSRAESLPYLVLEAAAAGVPLIATNVGGIPEIFEGEADRLLPPGDARALAAAMRAAIAAVDQMTAEAMLRRMRAKQKFSLAAMAGRTEDIYRDALEGRYRMLRASPAAEADLSR